MTRLMIKINVHYLNYPARFEIYSNISDKQPIANLKFRRSYVVGFSFIALPLYTQGVLGVIIKHNLQALNLCIISYLCLGRVYSINN